MFSQNGFVLVSQVIPALECEEFAAMVINTSSSVGSRDLLAQPWCGALAKRLQHHIALSDIIPSDFVAVQCNYFEKSVGRNWLVPIHQDLTIPVTERVAVPGLINWSEKEGALYVQAPDDILEQLVAIRLHLDCCTSSDGPLHVVPGSHRLGRIEATTAARARTEAVSCPAEQGDVLAMRPLLLHGSTKATGTGRRRVLHFVFGPRSLAHGLQWRLTI